ncbi:BtrH N-terminal domain-containing protein [Micromonospora sp. ATCC 39149]|uniref:BtrH N-terminal domain-containing protein n=1 Tax=Micromonospora carbonacea TaxID=47853 RepID=A0A7D5YIC2_9ACTN|nr:BtrH N-terminal domain-containing protein [Micromonospora sp. ATCC 39149]QLJ98574.1 BtrH N-terminal domain-containing protein [Micromonospora carbonacea]
MIVENVSCAGGQHCETTALGVLLRHEGIDLSEPMRFGLGEGLGFVYWDAKNMGFPFLGGRTKPMTITRTLAARLGLTMRVEETTSVRKAWHNVAAAIDAGRPVGLQLDSYHLDYFTVKVHFGGHVVAMYGYDDTHAYLVDTAQQGGAVTTTRASLELARNVRGPMTARNLSYTLACGGDRPKLGEVVGAAIRSNAHDFLNPPIANLGHRGIRKAAGQVPKWLTRSADPRHDLALAASLMERGGTGGALFRAMYRDFLAECCTIVDDDNLRRGHQMYREIAPLWTEVSRHLAAAAETTDHRHLVDASAVLSDLADREHDAMQTLANIRTG